MALHTVESAAYSTATGCALHTGILINFISTIFHQKKEEIEYGKFIIVHVAINHISNRK